MPVFAKNVGFWAPDSPDYSWFHTNPKRKRGPQKELPSLAIRVSMAQRGFLVNFDVFSGRFSDYWFFPIPFTGFF